MLSFLKSSSPPWTAEQVPDLTGKVAIVTGSNTGIGKEIVRILLARNAKVYMACRSRQRAEEAIADLKHSGTNSPIFLELDLGDLANVRRAAHEFLRQEKKLHILFNNAGVATSATGTTKDGFELHFGINVAGHYLLTRLLTPALLAASSESPQSLARVVHLSSGAASQPGTKLDYDTLISSPKDEKDVGKLQAMRLYGDSKLGSAVISREFSRRFGGQVVHIAVNPGAVDTELTREAPVIIQKIAHLTFQTTEHGALTPLYAGTASEAAEMNGKFLNPVGKVGKAPSLAEHPEEGLRLWKWLEEKTGATDQV